MSKNKATPKDEQLGKWLDDTVDDIEALNTLKNGYTSVSRVIQVYKEIREMPGCIDKVKELHATAYTATALLGFICKIDPTEVIPLARQLEDFPVIKDVNPATDSALNPNFFESIKLGEDKNTNTGRELWSTAYNLRIVALKAKCAELSNKIKDVHEIAENETLIAKMDPEIVKNTLSEFEDPKYKRFTELPAETLDHVKEWRDLIIYFVENIQEGGTLVKIPYMREIGLEHAEKRLKKRKKEATECMEVDIESRLEKAKEDYIWAPEDISNEALKTLEDELENNVRTALIKEIEGYQLLDGDIREGIINKMERCLRSYFKA